MGEGVQAKAVSNGSVVGRPEQVLGPQGAKVSSTEQLPLGPVREEDP